MKWVLFSIFITCISQFAVSQVIQPLPEIFSNPKNGISQLQNKTYLPKRKQNSFVLQNQIGLEKFIISGLPAGVKVYNLPLDNMPCLVPDMTSIAKIPNAKTYAAGLSIPNPYYQSDLFPVLK